MLVEKIGYVGEIVSISGRTTGDVHAVVSCYAPTIIQTYDTPSYRKYQRLKTGCIPYKENTPRNLNILCYDNIVIFLLTLLSQWVECTISTTIVVITPTDGLPQILVGIRSTRSEA